MGGWRAERLEKLGSSIFAEVGHWKKQAISAGRDVIDLSIGSPDRPPAEAVRQTLAQAALREDAYAYPGTKGTERFLRTAAAWMRHRFGVKLDPTQQILSLMGSQDGLGHLALALCNAGDTVLLPNPGYPVYAASLALAAVEPYYMPLREENNFLPDLEAIPVDAWSRAKFILLNYPSNPLSAVAPLSFFERLLAKAKQYNVLIVHDLAYSEMAFDGERPVSILQIAGASDYAIEFHSTSKSFHLAGGRIAFVAGNIEAVQAIGELKANIDYGVFLPVQEAAITALEQDMLGTGICVSDIYGQRREVFIEALQQVGWPVATPKATMFVWAKLPEMRWSLPNGERWTSRTFAQQLLVQQGVAVVPGDAFGSEGEGYVRIALVAEQERLVEAGKRIGQFIRGEIQS